MIQLEISDKHQETYNNARLLAEHGPGTISATVDRSLSDIERTVANAWAAILEHEQFGPQTFAGRPADTVALPGNRRKRLRFDHKV